MTTEKEAFIAMLTRANVLFFGEYETETFNGEDTVMIPGSVWGGGYVNRGYGGFFAEFCFDPDGSLESTGVWE